MNSQKQAAVKSEAAEIQADKQTIPAVAGGTPIASRGATLPYVEYEAEKAATNGTVIGPDRTFTQLASEASGRKAIQLKTRGQYVEFTLMQPANAMTIRYSIPDSTNGTGLTAPLSLYINGTHKQNLTLTSKYSWFYGGYPFTNNPGDGKPHHFYDETRIMFGQLAVGTKVRLQIDAGDTAPWYIIDLADFYQVHVPYIKPSGYISITDTGADPTGATDSTQAMNKAVAAAENQRKGVWIPAGTFTITSHIIVNNVTVRGAGPWYSVLQGNGVGVYGNASPNPSKNVKLYDFAIFGEVMNRDDSAQVNGIGGALGGGSIIQDIWIEHTKVGMWFDGPFSGLLITDDTIRDTTADGINLHDGITNTIIEQTQVRNTGDDGLAMWSEKNPDQNDVFRFNTVQLPILANNIAIYGGANNSVTDNIVSDTITQGGGIHIGNRFNAVPLSGTTTIARNTLVRTGVLDPNWQFGVGAMWFYALDSAMTGKINVTDDEIDDSSYEAIHFIGSNITNVTFNHININTASTFAIQEQAAGSAQFNYVMAKNIAVSGQYNCGVNFAIIKGLGNTGWNSTHCGFPTTSSPTPSSISPSTAPVPTPVPTPLPAPPGKLVTAIDAGGTGSGHFTADTNNNQGHQLADLSSPIDTSRVGNPPPQVVYQTCHWNNAFTYVIPGLKANTAYTLRLDWAELSFQASGQRQFNVAVNGKTVLHNFDVYAEAGYKKALAKQFTLKANSSGQIVISFTRGPADNPFINGIEVYTT
ncbi:MAG TPA: malectin domain-containing carbohydrate-binding protein [Ktedonobacteraceae bacterium]